ncbi:exopolyphosphatase [gamma proteobacterium HTCC5015]|nr:exopolyphosphatase [gamma proteobacterium HTCC5015]
MHTYAAIDLGSNSFHMIIAREESDGHLRVLDSLRETVRLGGGLNKQGDIDEATTQLALNTLSQFGQRLAEFDSGRVRCVGTNTLRRVKAEYGFLERAEKALGHPIDIISGREEARLIFLGTTHSTAPVEGNQLVLDIGGGSTEIILGAEGRPHTLESVNMGCVSWTQRFFDGGKISAKAYDKAITQAQLQMQPLLSTYKKLGWSNTLGCSGTIKAVETVAQANDWCEQGISAKALKKLRKALIKAGHIDKIDIEALKDNRQPIIIGGVAVLEAVFKALDIKHMDVSQSSLREGLLYDLIGRTHKEDIREQTVQTMVQQYAIDSEQAERVENTAVYLFRQVAEAWQLNEEHEQELRWACRLAEVGLNISHSKYHRHSEYILAYADMPGFSWHEQAVLAVLARLHRSKFHDEKCNAVPSQYQKPLRYLAVLLRLSVLLHRSRQEEPLPELTLFASDQSLLLRVDEAWIMAHPLTCADLLSEMKQLEQASWKFTLDWHQPSQTLREFWQELSS